MQFSALMERLSVMENKQNEKFTGLFSESHQHTGAKHNVPKANIANKKRTKHQKESKIQTEANKKHIKNLSNKELADDQINSPATGLKFIPTPATDQTQIKRQLLCDFNMFSRTMRLQYIFHGTNNKPHPFHVKSTWEQPIQSITLESYLEEVKSELAEIELKKPKNNLPPANSKAIKALKRDTEINLKKTNKGTTTVVMNTQDKIKGQIQLDKEEHHNTLVSHMVADTYLKVQQLINDLYHGNHR